MTLLTVRGGLNGAGPIPDAMRASEHAFARTIAVLAAAFMRANRTQAGLLAHDAGIVRSDWLMASYVMMVKVSRTLRGHPAGPHMKMTRPMSATVGASTGHV